LQASINELVYHDLKENYKVYMDGKIGDITLGV
jgi:hypothetical protein